MLFFRTFEILLNFFKMRFYQGLSSIRFLRNSYGVKFLFVAFIGIHIPLIGILFFVLFEKNDFSVTSLLLFALVMTLIATGVTLFVLKKLIRPIELASNALNNYRRNRVISSLPLHFSDEAGMLLSNVQDSILESEKFITEKQDLIYLLSHDLKTFAGNPKSLAKMILETNPSNEVKELAELICESSEEQFSYIENFIKMLKEQDEMLKPGQHIKLLALNEIVESVEKHINGAISKKGIQLVKKLDVVSAHLRIDEDLLVRVLVNLVNNAVKFSFPDSEVQLKIYREQNKLYIKVIDQGVGFEIKDSEKMFFKFTKMSRLGTKNESSTGLGLYLCRQIVERHHGLLIASSEGTNKGATFTVVFNLV